VLSASLIPGAQDWRIGVLVPEDHYLGELLRARRALVFVASSALLILLAGGILALRGVRRGLGQIVKSAEAMRDFDFSPASARSPFADVQSVMGELEQAKTALRAMGRYVPLGLVRRLYRDRREPELGGELREVSLLFTDIAGFTTASERLSPDRLALALGRYFEALTQAIHANGGTVDKYIGDAVMAIWNAPEPSRDHAARACAAALACHEASLALERESAREGLPPFRTRLGLHRAEVMVGHFGAPDRISYTALGDGVNLASRIEGLNKVYRTAILASESIRESAGDAFSFRLVDKVAVKGRRGGVRVYELLGGAGAAPPHVVAYERAFLAYLDRRFEDALSELRGHPDDPPGRVLATRCRAFLESPPPSDWDGVFVAREK
jgi:adenylate cyclase